MKAIIFAGGLGTRISEESQHRPKPMVEIGGKPILWHIMKIYSSYGIDDFVICLGYKGYLIKEYFCNYFLHTADVTVDVAKNQITVHNQFSENWRISLVDTGEVTMTGGRLKRIAPYLDESPFCLTYGDGVANVDLNKLINAHKNSGSLATVTAVQPPGRFGALEIRGDKVVNFQEKPDGDGGWINGGFFVLEPGVLDYISGDDTIWEQAPLQAIASEKKLSAYFHHGFWHALDTLRDKNTLEKMWASGDAPWKVW